MTEEKGIRVLTATGGWRVEKGGHFLTGTWPEVLSTKATVPGASLFPWLVVVKVWGDALRDSRLVVEGDDEGLVTLINTQNHKNIDVMGVVREWMGLLLKHNIHWVARLTPFGILTLSPPLPFIQVLPNSEETPGMVHHPQQDSIQDWPWR